MCVLCDHVLNYISIFECYMSRFVACLLLLRYVENVPRRKTVLYMPRLDSVIRSNSNTSEGNS